MPPPRKDKQQVNKVKGLQYEIISDNFNINLQVHRINGNPRNNQRHPFFLIDDRPNYKIVMPSHNEDDSDISDVQERECIYFDTKQSDTVINLRLSLLNQLSSRQSPPRSIQAPKPTNITVSNPFPTIQNCAICLQPLPSQTTELAQLPQCKHTFCIKCIQSSAQYSTRCPYCRLQIGNYIQRGDKCVTIVDDQEDNHNEEQIEQDDSDWVEPECQVCQRSDSPTLLQCQYCFQVYCHPRCDSRLVRGRNPYLKWYCQYCVQNGDAVLELACL